MTLDSFHSSAVHDSDSRIQFIGSIGSCAAITSTAVEMGDGPYVVYVRGIDPGHVDTHGA
jgi:hypothetical protein